ncbi:MAG TPA: hypothetical protein VFQ61_19005, partial [Polyangiaceae bacterium]|nr:hypothetical protein [Polyangiaceae bacterium]
LLQVCLHASMHSFVRSPGLRLYVDIDRAVTDRNPQWESFVQEAVRTGAPGRVGVALGVAQGLLGTPVPLDVIEALIPRGWRRAGLERLLGRESVLGAGRKLPGARTVLLDVLLDPRAMTSWARDVVLPPEDWLREHFGRGSVQKEGVVRLHARRYLNLALRWRPE